MKKNLFRKFLALFLTGTLLAGVGCKDYDDDIKEINNKIEGLETGKLASLEEQLNSLKVTISTLEQADKLTPNWSWTAFFKSQGVAPQPKFSLAIPAFHEEVSKMIGDTDPATWRAYLRFHAVDAASPYLSQPFVQENFDFYGKVMSGQQEMKPRWKRAMSSSSSAITWPSPASSVSMSPALSGVMSRRNAGTFSASNRPWRS